MSHTFLVKRLEHLKATLERKIARLDQLRQLQHVRRGTKEKIKKKRAELEHSIDELERVIDRLQVGP